ncbi:hypothetical protein EGR_00745 [Echinococcus granulosus]|uniref:Uncharacterized protein n=1 Tax=Echinococcus granulosus TaxID=6210 RepID=W6UU75_ECHGR|nr:hypothetical protein EGR_00745 [Echinococcus granulosus]EUB64201.1 hypothetical protein EGR_00745 [Echinococcus granulosus]
MSRSLFSASLLNHVSCCKAAPTLRYLRIVSYRVFFFFSLTNSIILNYEPISALVNDKMHFSLFTRLCIYQSRSSCEYSYPWWFLSSIQQIWVP